ncbi:MAG: hypothetical protein IPK07_18035 [Deltaproteobacteria bacterium]|nr:hypothetical protein [Deltaproteobacteria bacterium]
MKTLTLRNVSDETLRWLRGRAAAHERSVNAEILDLLSVARADELAEQHATNPFARTFIEARRRGVRTTPSSRKIVRADRDRDARS